MLKDAVATMGAILPDDVGGRDAVHVAVISAVAGEDLYSNEDVGLLDLDPTERGERYASNHVDPLIGIVDPFIKETIKEGQRFWLFLYPRTITSLKHIWTHPDVPEVEPKEPSEVLSLRAIQKPISEQWLRDFCKNNNCPGYGTTLAVAKKFIEGKGDSWDKDYLHFSGVDASGGIPDEFWDHVEIILDKKLTGKRPKHFSCAC